MVLGILAYVRPNSPNISIVRKRRGSKNSCGKFEYLTASQGCGLIPWLCNRIFILHQCGIVKLLYSVKELRFEQTCCFGSGRSQKNTNNNIYSFVVQNGSCLLLLSTMSPVLTLGNVPFFR